MGFLLGRGEGVKQGYIISYHISYIILARGAGNRNIRNYLILKNQINVSPSERKLGCFFNNFDNP